jgi:hypothetical protein
MPIDVACPSCGYSAQVPDDFSGKLVACPACKNTFRFESAASVIVAKKASFGRQPGDTAAINQPFSPSVLAPYFKRAGSASLAGGRRVAAQLNSADQNQPPVMGSACPVI